MEYTIVMKKNTGNGLFQLTAETTADIEKWMADRGYKKTGVQGTGLVRKELVGQPIFDNDFAGPMWDGEGRIRYEDWESYNILSM